ncbi:MAG: 6-bladed beta-propeller [Candidatus Paceibacterota bacterium]
MKYLITLIFIFIFISCSKKEIEQDLHQNVATIQVNLDTVVDTLYMSDYFSDLEYQPLRTPAGRPIGRIRKIMPQEEQVALYDEAKKSVWIFSRDGEFVNEVQIQQGRGPGEIMNVTDVIFTEDGLIHALGTFKIVVYNLEGNFVREVNFEKNFFVYKFIFDGEIENYIGYAGNSSNRGMNNKHSKHNLIFFDLDGKITGSRLPIMHGKHHIDFVVSNNFPAFSDQQYHFSHLTDTLFSIDGFSVTPEFVLDYGENSIPNSTFARRDNYSNVYHEWSDFMNEEIYSENYITYMYSFNKTDKFIHFRVGSRQEKYNIFYDRQSKEVNVGPGRMTNDIDFGYVPFIYESSDEALFTIIETNDLLSHLTYIYENDLEKYRDPRMARLRELAHSLSENRNPILQVATFK